MITNVFGEPIQNCGKKPMTGFYRDGFCSPEDDDWGKHLVCAVMTEEFLEFSLKSGNDLTNPQRLYDFPGLKPGDRWCVCLLCWLKAKRAGKAPQIILESTSELVLNLIPLSELITFARKNNT